MEIYLMQHGPCLPESVDPERPLSPMGRETVHKTARAMNTLSIRPEIILTSPKLRAFQTADILAQALGFPERAVGRTDALKAMTPARDTLAFLEQYRDRSVVLLVGHQPSIGAVAGALIGTRTSDTVEVSNAGLIRVDAPSPLPGGGKLVWSMPAAHLARMI